MLGDIGRIPIITLSGCKSLSDILSDLPLPQPLPKSSSGNELIEDPRLAQEGQVCLQRCDDWLADSLASVLSATSVDAVVFKNDQKTAPIDFHTLPPLLKETISRKSSILEENRSFQCIYSSKEVLQILSRGASHSQMASPTKVPAHSASRQNLNPQKIPAPLVVKPQPQPVVGDSGVYSVTSVEPLKLSIKRASIVSASSNTPNNSPSDGTKKQRTKRRSRGSNSSASHPNSIVESSWNPEEVVRSPIVQQTQSQLLAAPQPTPLHPPVPSSSVQPQPPNPPPPPPPLLQPMLSMDPNYHNINQAFSSIFSQLLQPEESAIASLLSNHSDGQSSGTPASVADAALHQPLVRSSPPLSVPSYPATPCIPPMSVANSHQSTAALSPLLLDPQSSAGGQSQDTAAAIPRGLSAYLQKSRNLASPNPHDESQQSSSSTTLQVDGAATSKTSPWRERRIGATNLAPPVSSSGNGYPTASSSLANTPSGHERNGSGSGKDGKRGHSLKGRRRRSELEELSNWHLRDQATLHTAQSSSANTTTKANRKNQKQQPEPIPESCSPISDAEDQFIEPLGERVKRRRQARTSSSTTKKCVAAAPPPTPVSVLSKPSTAKQQQLRRRDSSVSSLASSSSSSSLVDISGINDASGGKTVTVKKQQQQDNERGGDDSSSSCLTDSSLPRKQPLQRLCEEVAATKSRVLVPSPSNWSATPQNHLKSVALVEVDALPRRMHSTTNSPSVSPPPAQSGSRSRHKRPILKRAVLSPGPSSGEEENNASVPRKSFHSSSASASSSSRQHRSASNDNTKNPQPMPTSTSDQTSLKKAGRVRARPHLISNESNEDDGPAVQRSRSRSGKKSSHRLSSSSSLSSLSSSSGIDPPPIRRRESTPSTQPCTSSSAMDYDSAVDELSGLKAAEAKKQSDPAPSPTLSIASTALSGFNRMEEVTEAERRKAEEVAKFAAALTHFSAHITVLLGRVGGLELVKIAGEMTTAPIFAKGGGGEDGIETGGGADEGTPDQTPEEARLSRRDLNTLYQEAEQVRVAGSISNEPNGRLVRLLNLLLVNIQDAVSLMAPNPTPTNFKEAIRRRKARIQRRQTEGTGTGNDEWLSESLLWSHPAWFRVLRGLDAALISLHIVAGSDVPRARLLAMEDLIEAITNITHFQFNRLVTVITNSNEYKRSSNGTNICMSNSNNDIAAGLTSLVRDSIGNRLSEALCGLASLVRLHRFTDSLIMRLTDLALLVLSAVLSAASKKTQSSSTFPTAAAAVLLPDQPPPSLDDGCDDEERQRRQKDYYLHNAWRLQLQRSALALIATIFSQYDKHRHMIASDIISKMVAPAHSKGSKGNLAGGNFKALATARNFWILASGSFVKDWQPFQIPSRSDAVPASFTSPTRQLLNNSSSSSSGAACQQLHVANRHFLLVHPFTATLLALVQGLIPAPSYMIGGRRSSSAGAPATPSSGVSQQSTTTGTGLSDQHGMNSDAMHLAKEEKATNHGYTNALRTSHYLLSEMFKKAVTKGEDDLRPLVDTILVDLLRVTADSPVEWPVASLLLNVFGKLLIQQLNGGSSRSQSPPPPPPPSASAYRNAEVTPRLVAADNLVTLAGGLRLLGRIRGSPRSDIDLAEAATAISTFLNSSVVGLYHLTLGIDDERCGGDEGERGITARLASYANQRDFAYQLISRLRYQHFDGLSVTSRRFHLATWLCETTQELASLNQQQQSASTSAVLDVNPERHRKALEERRCAILMDFASTHHSVAGMAPWLPTKRHHNAGGPTNTLGEQRPRNGGIISPAVSEPGGEFVWGGADSMNPLLALYTGHGLGADGRRRKMATAHRLATKVAAQSGNSLSFELLFMHIVKLLYDPSIPLRSRGLKCLSSLLDICPDICIQISPNHSHLPLQQKTTANSSSPSDLLSIIPVRLMDNSPAVREAAVELVGRLVSSNPVCFLTPLYQPLVDRVLDLCVSVRKRAVRSLQTLLMTGSSTGRFVRLSTKQKTDAYITLLRRLNDEDTVKKLVLETFLTLWFTPIETANPENAEIDATNKSAELQLLKERVFCVCEVVASFRNRGFHMLEEFITAILNHDAPEKSAQADAAVSEIVNYLVKIIRQCQANGWRDDSAKSALSVKHSRGCPLHSSKQRRRNLTNTSDATVSPGATPHSSFCTCAALANIAPSITSALSVLYLIAKCRSSLVVRHVPMLAEVINQTANSTQDAPGLESNALSFTTGAIEACFSHLAGNSSKKGAHFSDLLPNGLDTFEKSLIVLLQQHCRAVVDSSMACLSTIVNRFSNNFARVTTCFAQFYECLTTERLACVERANLLPSTSSRPDSSLLRLPLNVRPKVLRALYTVGLICRHFSLEDLANSAFQMTEHYSKKSGSSVRRAPTNLSILTQQATIGTSLRDEVFDTLMFFAEKSLRLGYDSAEGKHEESNVSGVPLPEDVELGKKAIAGVAFLANRHDHFFCSSRLQAFFTNILSAVAMTPARLTSEAAADLQCIILDSLTNFLVDEEKKLQANDGDWLSRSRGESLKELGDRRDGYGSAVSQVYLPSVRAHCILSRSPTVRNKALGLISTILRQGLVHPVDSIAALICLQTDPEASVRNRATHQLQEVEKKSPGFVALKAEPGIRLGYSLQRLLATAPSSTGSGQLQIPRGATIPTSASSSSSQKAAEKSIAVDPSVQARPLAINHSVYSLLQGNRQHRRSLLTSLVTLFDLDHTPASSSSKNNNNCPPSPTSDVSPSVPDGRNGLSELIYIADQLSHFPYKTLDEINYLAHSLDLRVSSLGSAVVRALQDCLIAASTSSSAQVKSDASGYDRKVTNLIEDAEAEVFSRRTTDHHAEAGSIERKVLEYMSRLVAAEPRRSTRSLVVRNAPACLLLMAVRRYLQDAYGVTASRLSSYTAASGDEKQWQKPIAAAPTARCVQLGVFRRLMEVPDIVIECALDPAWPAMSEAEASASANTPSDQRILRLALMVHRNLLAMDEDSGTAVSSAPAGGGGVPGSQVDSPVFVESLKKFSAVEQRVRSGGVGGGAKSSDYASLTSKSSAKATQPAQSRIQKHTSPSAAAAAASKLRRPDTDDIDSLSSLSEGLPAPPTKKLHSAPKPSEKKQQQNTNSLTSSTRNIVSKHSADKKKILNIPTSTIPKRTSDNQIKRAHADDDSLSSLEDSPRPPTKKTKKFKPTLTMTTKAEEVKVKAPMVVKPRYDLAPLPGTPDIRTQQQERRRRQHLKTIAAFKTSSKQLTEKRSATAVGGGGASTSSAHRKEVTSSKKTRSTPLVGDSDDVEISSVSSVSSVSTPSSSTTCSFTSDSETPDTD